MMDALDRADGLGCDADAGGRAEDGRLGSVRRQGAGAKHCGCRDRDDGELAHRVTLLGLPGVNKRFSGPQPSTWVSERNLNGQAGNAAKPT
jgi:hypothetical protein